MKQFKQTNPNVKVVITGGNDRYHKGLNYTSQHTQGNAIDLYPSNKITFGYDSAENFFNSYSWGKLTGLFNSSTQFDDTGLARRYFLGAYSNYLDFSGYVLSIKEINSQVENSNFYPGFFNSCFSRPFVDNEYIPVIMGNSFTGENVDKQTIRNKRNLLSDGWFALGYGGVAKLKDSYSCFTPIFIKQPINLVHCKIGQSPTFRCLAVDYHTIPEDKINDRYPEIVYWTEKLKITTAKKRNKYPLTYKWFRIKKSDCRNNFENFLTSGYFSQHSFEDYYHNPTGAPPLEPANPNGNWCCLEQNDPNCTLIHPTSCEPSFSPNASWSYKYEGNPIYEEAKRNNFYMKFKKLHRTLVIS